MAGYTFYIKYVRMCIEKIGNMHKLFTLTDYC